MLHPRNIKNYNANSAQTITVPQFDGYFCLNQSGDPISDEYSKNLIFMSNRHQLNAQEIYSFQCNEITPNETHHIQWILIRNLPTNGLQNHLLIASYYRSPNRANSTQDMQNITRDLTQIIRNENLKDPDIVICGDFNIHHPYYKYSAHNPYNINDIHEVQNLISLFTKYNIQIMNENTQYTFQYPKNRTTKHSTLDFTLASQRVAKNGFFWHTLPLDGSDHCPIQFIFQTQSPKNNTHQTKKIQMNHWNFVNPINMHKYKKQMKDDLKNIYHQFHNNPNVNVHHISLQIFKTLKKECKSIHWTT